MKKRSLLLAVLLFAFGVTACKSPADAENSSSSIVGKRQSDVQIGARIAPKGLGFSFHLPALMEGCTEVEILRETSSESDEETTTVMVYYTTETEKVFVCSLSEMSAETWEERQTQPGSIGVELGRSEDGRVVELNVMQSNPFAEGDPAYALFNDLREQIGVVHETFAFTK